MVSHSSKISGAHRQRNKECVAHPLEEEAAPTSKTKATAKAIFLGHPKFQTTTRESSHRGEEATISPTVCK